MKRIKNGPAEFFISWGLISLKQPPRYVCILIEAYGELYQICEKLRFFQGKYQKDFKTFSKLIETEGENFEHYDDYIEWKAYDKLYGETLQKIEDLKSRNFQITQ